MPKNAADTHRENSLTALFAEKRAEAEARFWSLMSARGLFASDGWAIHETCRTVAGGTELILRPIHMRHLPPADIECIVRIEHETHEVESKCEPR